MKKTDSSATLNIARFEGQKARFCIKGTTPFIFNAMSEKAKHSILNPPGRMSQLEKATNLKHFPMDEYRGSMYQYRDEDKTPTRLYFPASAFKSAMATASLEIDGITKAAIARLMWVQGTSVRFYGIPQMHMCTVLLAGMNRVPDIRTRAIVPEWALELDVSFVTPKLNGKAVANLLEAAGMLVGVGDFRQEKGKGNYGQFEPVNADDEDFKRIIKNCGRAAQDAAIKKPAYYDRETENLFQWWEEDISARRANGNAAVLKADRKSSVAA